MTALPGKPAANAKPANESGVERLVASSPGARLQKGREAAKLDISQAAEALHLSPGVVKALEADDYRVLPNATFVKGYIRSYARLIGIPAEELVRSYEAITGNSNIKPLEPIQAPHTGPQHGTMVKLALAAALIVVVAFIFWPDSAADVEAPPAGAGETASDLQTAEPQAAASEQDLDAQASSSQEPEAVDEAEAAEIPAQPEPKSAEEPVQAAQGEAPQQMVEPAVDPILEPALEPTLEPAPEQTEPPSVQQAAAEVGPTEALEAANVTAPVADGELSMAFTGDCWVEVRDGTGELIYSNLRRHGETLNLKGVPPFEAKLGNGNVVSLSYNGQPVSFHVPSHNVVRVRLGE